ncbi:MAG TPA: hypothetical protein VMW58_08965, partial [Anaerolineae bacterium]|nr:hypothetical protein [Anaerolineae bacterium]
SMYFEGGKDVTKDEKRRRTQRQPYRKPRVEQVELIAEEQVLGGCKAAQGQPGITMTGPEYGSCYLWGCALDGS